MLHQCRGISVNFTDQVHDKSFLSIFKHFLAGVRAGPGLRRGHVAYCQLLMGTSGSDQGTDQSLAALKAENNRLRCEAKLPK